MNDKTYPAWDILKSLGFKEDPNVISDSKPGLSFNFGNFKLSAGHLLNMSFQDVVLLSGIMSTPRTIAEVDCQMPQEVESWEQGVAWVTWCLDNQGRRIFKPEIPVPWLEEGRKYRHLLPWERQRAAYADRAYCTVQREWARVGLRDLAEQMANSDDMDTVTIEFDGEVLKIRCNDMLIAMPANGNSWPPKYAIKVRQLRHLPKRLMHNLVGFSIWEDALTINNYRYPGVVSIDSEEDI